MIKKKDDKQNNQAGGVTHKKDMNAGSGAFNQGSEQDPNYDEGTPVSDKEKKKKDVPVADKKKENPKDGNIGKNNAGGFE